MRWRDIRINAIRIRKQFLFLPKKIGDETRWLETTSWTEVYEYVADVPFGHWSRKWVTNSWND